MCVFLFCAANGDIHLFSYFTYEKKKKIILLKRMNG